MSQESSFSESIGDFIIAFLLSNKSSYQFHKIIREREFARFKKNSVRMTFSRLHKKGYLENIEGDWSLTKKGKAYGDRNLLFSYFSSPFNKSQQSNTILSFDIPEIDRIKRTWLRNQLKVFGYKMLQQSMWLGPGPLPTDFLKRLNELNLKKNIKIFAINKKEI